MVLLDNIFLMQLSTSGYLRKQILKTKEYKNCRVCKEALILKTEEKNNLAATRSVEIKTREG